MEGYANGPRAIASAYFVASALHSTRVRVWQALVTVADNLLSGPSTFNYESWAELLVAVVQPSWSS